MSPEDFNFIANMLKEKSGLSLSADKGYLMESRLMPVARKNGMSSLEELIDAVKGKDLAIQLEVVEAMTTNESFFFRDSKPFNQFKELVLPALLKRNVNKKSFRIWSAACSSGQEPYSLAMILREHASQLAGWKTDIVATDISQEIIDKAKRGEYTQFEVQRGLPVQYLIKHFKKDGESWNIAEDIKSMVQYKKWNLLDDYKSLGAFDVVFCRNVLIYFDQPTKSKVLSKIADAMAPEGYLYLGGAETVLGISNRFKPVPGQRGIYMVDPEGKNAPTSITPPGFSTQVKKPEAKKVPAGSMFAPKPASTIKKPASTFGQKPSPTTNFGATKKTSSLFGKKPLTQPLKKPTAPSSFAKKPSPFSSTKTTQSTQATKATQTKSFERPKPSPAPVSSTRTHASTTNSASQTNKAPQPATSADANKDGVVKQRIETTVNEKGQKVRRIVKTVVKKKE